MNSELLIAIVSALFIIGGVKLWQKGNYLLLKGKKAEAVIFKNNFKRSGSSGGLYYPVVRFRTNTNEWITQELNTGYLPAKPEGSQIEIVYNPDDPYSLEINSPLQLEILPRVFVGMGIAGFVLGLLAYLEIITI